MQTKGRKSRDNGGKVGIKEGRLRKGIIQLKRKLKEDRVMFLEV
jgi:hypothetical protein